MAFRVDIGGVLRPVRYTPDGAARVDATLTRTGVFVYRDSDGNDFREYRPADEVFKPESMASFEALPVTDNHPPVMVSPANVAEYKRGRSSDRITRDGTHMIGGLIIDDLGLLAKMKAGKREVSNGYECDLDMTPGVSPEGERYDAVQRNIRGNHIAIVDAGRAGTARVRMDGAAIQIDSAGMLPRSDNEQRAASAAKDERMDLAQALAALHAANEKLGATSERLSTESKRADTAEQAAKDAAAATVKADAKADAAEQRAKVAEDAATAAKTDADKVKTDALAAAPSLVKARVALVTSAHAAGVTAIKVDGKDVAVLDADDNAIRCAVIAKLDGAELPADKASNPAYVEARFDLACERAGKSGAAFGQLAAVVVAGAKTDTSGNGGAVDREAEARKKMHEDSRNAWKTLGKTDKDQE